MTARTLSTLLHTLVLSVLACWPSALAGEAGSAEQLVRESGVQGGLVVHVGGGNPGRTAALRVDARYLVQGLERDAARVAETRAHLRKRGLLGPVTAIRWDGKRLPYADGTVNLLIVESQKDVAADEMMRVLAPRGLACVKSNGTWKKQAKPWPGDIDEWTHFLHGPDNNAVAEDTRIAPPRHIQWVAGPPWARSHDHLSSLSAAVTAAGRLFCIIDEGPIASVKAPAKWVLVARDAFSGVLLWKQPVAPWENQLRPFRSGPAELPRRLVAVGDRVYVTLGYGKPVTALDAATGRVVRTYAGTDNTHEIVVSDGRLYLVVSAPLDEESPTTGKVLRKFDVWRGAYGEYTIQFMPKHLRVLNAETGELVWKKDDGDARDVLPLTLAVAKGRVYFQNYSHVVALKAGSGEVAWRAERPGPRQRYAWLTPTLVVKDGVVLSADRAADKPVDTGAEDKQALEWRVSANHILTGGELVAFDAATGKELWRAPSHEGFNSPADVFVAQGKVWHGVLAWGRQPGITDVYDVRTGKVVATRPPDQKTYTLGFGHTRCYRHKATTRYVLQGRAGVEFVDMASDRVIAHHWVRGACQYGILPANGLLYAPHHPCACYITAKLNSFNALAATRRFQVPGSGFQDARLERGPAYDANLKPGTRNPEPHDWPTYRHDLARSGATPARLAPEMAPHWERDLPGPLTPVVVAGGRLYVVQREAHTVHALDAGKGSPIWQFAAGGRIDSPPTIHEGLVCFGSADGWVYCLRASDGALAWRFRAAPEARQIVSYDQLESVWPVPGNVLVCQPEGRDHPVAWFAAGRCTYTDGGMFLYGVNARTGELLVTQRISHRDPKTGQEPQTSIRGVSMPGVLPDVLSTDGSSLFLRHARFGFDGKPLPENVEHLFASVGFMDGSWWHRTYWQLGTTMGGGYGGWTTQGNRRISGRILVRAGDRVYGYGRKGYTITGSHLGLQSELQLFAADTALIKTPPDPKQKRRRGPSTKVRYLWTKAIPFHVRAMVLAGDTLVIAGPSDVGDLAAAQPKGAVSLWAVSPGDGSVLSKRELKASPVFDSFAACGGRLYFATVDGRVVCHQGR